jgi:hypothetical protein
MGYIDLLLNAPYKIDSMVWMRLMSLYFLFHLSGCLNFSWLNKLMGKMWYRTLK